MRQPEVRTETTKEPHVGGAALAAEGVEDEEESESLLEVVESVELGRGEGREEGAQVIGADAEAEGPAGDGRRDPEGTPAAVKGAAEEPAKDREEEGGQGGKSMWWSVGMPLGVAAGSVRA